MQHYIWQQMNQNMLQVELNVDGEILADSSAAPKKV